MRRLSALFVLAAAVLSAQVTYNAPTDLVIRPLPAPPRMGAAGTIVNDPTYGNPILRVTDGHTYPSYPGEGCVTPAASMANTWNTDSTRFFVYCHGMVVMPFNFDPATMKATRINPTSTGAGGLYLDLRGPSWSFHNRDLIYGAGADIKHSNRWVWQYNFATNVYTAILDVATTVPSFTGGVGSSSISSNDKLTLAFNGLQNSYRNVLWLDVNTKAYKVLDTHAGTVNGVKVSLDGQPIPFGVHLVDVDRTGRFVVISKGDGQTGPNLLVWDTSNNTFKHMTPGGGGHYAVGFGKIVNSAGAIYAEWLIRSMTSLGTYQLLLPALSGPAYGAREDHTSWNNARSDLAAPAIACLTKWPTETTKGPWDDEILGMGTDPAHQVMYRFGHSFAYYDGTEFWDLPRGNVSQDGRFFMFTSNWRKTLDTVRDVFIIRLPLGGSPPPTTPPSSTTATTTTVSSSLNPATSGQAVVFTAKVSPVSATGTVTFNDGSVKLGSAALSAGAAAFSISNLTPGNHSITASYAGATGFSASVSGVLTEVINAPTTSQPNTATAIHCTPDPSVVGQTVSLSAAVTPSAATGTVSFREGTTVLGQATLSGGSGTIPVTGLTVGSHSFTAVYSGSATYAASTSPVHTHTVLGGSGTITAVTSSVNPSFVGLSVTFTATVSPSTAGGTVRFLDGSTVVGSATLSGGVAKFTTSLLAAGSHAISAAYLGNGTYAASASRTLTQTVNGTTSTGYTPGLVLNGGFEDGVQNWTGLNWAGRALDSSIFYSGSASARLSANTTITQQIRVYSGVGYTLGVWYRSFDLSSAARVEWINSAGDVLATTVLPAAAKTGTWQFISKKDFGPSGVYYARIVLGATGSAGSAWYDSVSFVK